MHDNGHAVIVLRVDACVYGIKLTQEIVIVNGENHGKFEQKPLNYCGKITNKFGRMKMGEVKSRQAVKNFIPSGACVGIRSRG